MLRAIVGLSIVALAGPGAWAADTVVLPASYINVPEPTADVVASLVGGAYQRATGKGVSLTQRPVTPPASWAEFEAAEVARARAAGASEYIRVQVTGLDSSFTIRASLYRDDGFLIRDAHGRAASLDEAQGAAEEIARALAGPEFRQTPNPSPTAPPEAGESGSPPSPASAAVPPPAPEEPIFRERIVGIRTGLVFALASGVAFDPGFGAQFLGRFEADQFFLEVGAGVLMPTEATATDRRLGGMVGVLGGGYFFLPGSLAPYVGGGLEPRILFVNDNGRMRLMPYLTGGAVFLRGSDHPLQAELRVGQHVIASRAGASADYRPTEIGLSLGVGL